MRIVGRKRVRKLLRSVESKLGAGRGTRRSLSRALSNPPLRLPGQDQEFRIALIGAGAVARGHAKGLLSLDRIRIVGVAELNRERLSRFAADLGIPGAACFTDAEAMLQTVKPLHLVHVTTTAPNRVQLGRLALNAGVRCILLEKPIDVSLREARAFIAASEAAGATVAINYTRRWSLMYAGPKRWIERGVIGEVRSIACLLGKADLAMNASHYFDLARFLFESDPEWLVSHLDPVQGVNKRGAEYHDPPGYCLAAFENGARAFFDFSADLRLKNPSVVIKGTRGQIIIDEQTSTAWVTARGQRTIALPLPLKSVDRTVRSAVVELLGGRPPAATAVDGVKALEMIIAAHLSSRNGGAAVRFPLSDEEAEIGIVFP
jgi:predicted dehydrogenase